PERIAIGKPTVANASVEQRFRNVTEETKPREFMRLLREEPGTMIVFTRSKDGATRLWRWLHSHGVYDATFIHSDRTQADRELALKEFKSGKYRILIATDVAARGIHVDNVAHVINYDLPMEPEDYIHRIGRTGRQGATGIATTLITPRDHRTVVQIEKLLGKKLTTGPGASFEPRENAPPRRRRRRGGGGGGRGPSSGPSQGR
ncbi:MAG: C-terminal helicase domain-containing protein, partial [Bdellovibrionales bacterium]|nr:C-terminal helicase domain-containing protein [Bdellovibrionales bacterium]